MLFFKGPLHDVLVKNLSMIFCTFILQCFAGNAELKL